ncbi:MAG: hypothetical protein RLZZ44_1389 [Bacteroidota bacterium]|jgi:asparagine synthase (glutamine-hydrolysing)
MCGFVGGIGQESREAVLNSYKLLQKRGPDNQQCMPLGNGLTLGAARLAMTDPLDRSNQPMLNDLNGDVIVFNGEIYNFKKLKSRLLNKGIKFHTESDTEVLLKLLGNEGIDAISQLEGMFAFAFLDSSKNHLILCRDFLGKKPLYYHHSKNKIYFSSQSNLVKQYLESTSLNYESISTYLQLGYLIDPQTMYNEISAVEPGETIEFDLNTLALIKRSKISPKIYIEPSSTPISELLNCAIEERILGHEKCAISLSGGIDSSLIALQASKMNVEISAFSARWTDSDKERYNIDSELAREISKRLKINYHEVEMPKVSQIPETLREFVFAMEEPNANPTGLSMSVLYKAIASNGHRLVLTGDGADEIFGGYQRYVNLSKLKKFPQFKISLLDRLFANKFSRNGAMLRVLYPFLSSDSQEFWLYWHRIADQLQTHDLMKRNYYISIDSQNDFLNKKFNSRGNRVAELMFRDLLIWLDMESNRKLDRISMWNSIEARSPFQSENLIFNGYQRMSQNNFEKLGKEILVDQFPRLKDLPFNKSKMGFISPLGHWLRGNSNLVNTSFDILEKKLDFDRAVMNRLGDAPKLGNFREFTRLWSLVVLGVWLENA